MPLLDLNPVPPVVTPLQARRALRAAGLTALVADWLEEADEEVREAWDYAVEVRRDDAILAGAAASIGLSSGDLDELFRLAATF
jgi:hypothetical protein